MKPLKVFCPRNDEHDIFATSNKAEYKSRLISKAFQLKLLAMSPRRVYLNAWAHIWS